MIHTCSTHYVGEIAYLLSKTADRLTWYTSMTMKNHRSIRHSICGVSIILLGFFLLLEVSASEYVGSQSCIGCHAEEYEHWRQSHHFAAIAKATDKTVKADFNNSRFTYNNITSRFYKKDKRFYVLTDNAKGALEEFEITYTFGTYPLQQYLIDFPDGRKQVLSIIWDTRPVAEGGQRWYHLFPEAPSLTHGEPAVSNDDPLHWTGLYFNWNSRCASCHSTNLQKRYEPTENRYDTRWSELSVGCEACHGPAASHLTWTRAPSKDAQPHAGFEFSLLDRGIWKAVQDLANKGSVAATLKRSGLPADGQKQQCASCHSRRLEIGQADPRIGYYDTHLLSLLEPPLYYADGQIRDEVFEWGSFLQSKMHLEGVTCSNCHNPHSLELKADGNAVCTQCHNSAVFDTPKHHHHTSGSDASLCANCHMPSTTYMGVDARRDHSLRVPRPAQSAAAGAPNACNQCHLDRDAAWSQRSIDGWLEASGKKLSPHPFADAFHAAENRQTDAAPELLKIAADASLPAIARASAILRHAPYHNQQSVESLRKLLNDSAPLVRLGALRSMNTLPLAIRYQLLSPHLDEGVMSLRVEIARLLAGLESAQIDARHAEKLDALFDDFIKAAAFNTDMPESQVSLGRFYTERHDLEAAEKAFKQAITIALRHEGALLNLADFYRRSGSDSKAEPLLRRAIAAAPKSPAAHYAIGLFYVRKQDYEAAADSLRSATNLAPTDPRYAYTYALALEKLGRISDATTYLEDWTEQQGPNPEVDRVINMLLKQTK